MRLAIGDNLLIKPKNLITPWDYRIVSLPGQDIITQEININVDFKLVPVTSALFLSYINKTVLVEILVSDIVTEVLLVTVSGIYSKSDSILILVGLLGENMKMFVQDADFQDGFETEKTITLYNESTLITQLESFNWIRLFVNDFIPDARYQEQKVIQKVN